MSKKSLSILFINSVVTLGLATVLPLSFAGTNNVNNNTTLSARNIADVSNDNTKTKSSYDGNNAALKVTWKWNPGLNIVSNVTTNTKTRALDTPWYFVNQAFGYDTVAIEKNNDWIWLINY